MYVPRYEKEYNHMNDSFHKVIVGSGLLADILLYTLIHQKGESPADFCILSKQNEQNQILRDRYQIPTTDDLVSFIKSARVIVLAVDINAPGQLPEIIDIIKPLIAPNVLINSVTPKLSIEEIESYFPDNPVMRLGLNLSSISGNGTGVFCCGTKQVSDTFQVANYLMGTFGDIIEVFDETEMEQAWDFAFAVTCSCYIAMNCFFRTGVKLGITPQQAKEITISVFKGAAATCAHQHHDDILLRAFEHSDVAKIALHLLEEYGIDQDLHQAMHPDKEESSITLDGFLNLDFPEEEKYQVHYKNW